MRAEFHLEPEDREMLIHVACAITTPDMLKHRAKILLLADEGKTDFEIAKELGLSVSSVPRWIKRYADREPEDTLLDVIKTKEKNSKREIEEDARAWVREVAGPKDQRGSIQDVLDRVHEGAEAAGFPRLANVSWFTVRKILLEGEE